MIDYMKATIQPEYVTRLIINADKNDLLKEVQFVHPADPFIAIWIDKAAISRLLFPTVEEENNG